MGIVQKTVRARTAVCVAFALAASLIFGLAACGTSDGLDDAQANVDLSRVTRDDALAARISDEVKKDGVLTVGSNAVWAPAEFTGEDNETVIGYEIDLIKAVAKVLGLDVRIVNSSFSTIIPSVGSKFDVGVSGFTITAEREKTVTFVEFYRAGMSYAVRAGNPKKVDPDNLCGVRASVQVGTAEETALEDASAACVSGGRPAIDMQVYEAQTQATTAVITGRADVMYSDTPVSAYAVKQTKGKLELLGDPYDVAPQGIVVAKKDTATAEAIQGALNKLIDSGEYMRILHAWGVEDGAIERAEINPDVK
ncbi:ABC transporter substrate-binding protein [Alloscardovia macacae]|uniref:ABC transporter substrate-binding protein n=1 Tax=Alloscardovia macacae TaxID=1160091 RepID=A0A261F646_9BIFI|nr:ABC transporter substrate-binding protein [Alloscardovia macacae]